MNEPRIPGRRLLHAPGPSPVPDEVLWAMCRQPLDHGDPRLDATIAACERGLRRLIGTPDAHIFMYASNGHGVWEAVVENLAPVGSAVLIPGTGHFSEQWSIQTEALGRRVVRTPWQPGLPIDPQVVEDALRADVARDIRAVFLVHADTSSSVTSDLAALRDAVEASGHPAIVVVDVVPTLGVEPFSMYDLRADVVLGASQKGLMCPPGVGILAVNARAMDAARANPAPRYYWDWKTRTGSLSYQKFCGTAPQTLVAGLEAALGLLFREGLDAVFERHRRLAGAVRAAVEGWAEGDSGIGFFSQRPETRSNAVTTVRVAPGTDVEAIRTVARERFQVAFAGALGPLACTGFRIGHLGDQNPASILGCLAGIEAALDACGVPFGRDGVARAVAALARG